MTDYYVTSEGSGSGTGLSGDPFKTVTEVNAKAYVAGDNIYFNRGEVFGGVGLNCDRAGSDGSPITYGSYGAGANPVIDGELTVNYVINITTAWNVIDGLDCTNMISATGRGVRISSGATHVALNDITVSGLGDGIYCQTNGNCSFTNCTVNHGTLTYGIIINPANTTLDGTFTLSNITIQGDGINTINFPFYLRQIAGATLTVNTTDLNFINARCNAAAAPLLTCRGNIHTFINVDIDSSSIGVFAIGSSGEAAIATIDNLTFVDPKDTGIDVKSTSTLTLLNSTITNSQRSGIVASEADLTVRNTVVDGSGQSGTGDGLVSATSGNLVTDRVIVTNSTDNGIRCSGDTSNLVLTETTGNGVDGVNWVGSGLHYTEGCVSNTNGSSTASSGDGFSAHGTCTIIQRGCAASDNSGGGFTHVESSTGGLYNCSAYGNYYKGASYEDNSDVAGFRLNTDQDFIIQDCISMDNDIALRVTPSTIAELGTITLTGNNLYSTTDEVYVKGGKANSVEYGATLTWDAYVAFDTTAIHTDPEFNDVNTFDLSIAGTSGCVGTGSRTWAGANPVGTDGEPFSDFDTDKGAVQSTHGPFHSNNL